MDERAMVTDARTRETPPMSRPPLCLIVCLTALALSALTKAAGAHAQQTSQDELDALLPPSERDDPIGRDANSRSLGAVHDRAPRGDAPDLRFGPKPPPLRAQKGEVLTALPSTRETRHGLELRLIDGLAHATHEMRFETPAQTPCELRYRLAVPPGSGLAELEVCNAAGCQRGVPEPAGKSASAYDAAVLARGESAGLPVAHAALDRDERGEAIVLRAAPLSKDAPLTLRVGWVAPAPLRGGVVRLSLPARGMDPRVAPAQVAVHAEGLIDTRLSGLQVDGGGAERVQLDPWTQGEVTARLPSGGAAAGSVLATRCGKRRCLRARAVAGSRPLSPVDLVIALDVSPSTLGPARGRLLTAVTELLASAPPGSRVRALAFAARAKPLVGEAMEPSQVSLRPFARAIAEAELGAATRFRAIWALAGKWLRGAKSCGHGARRACRSSQERRLRPVIALVGDGGLSDAAGRAFAKARRAGVVVSVVNLGDRATRPALRERVIGGGGLVIEAGKVAEDARAGRSAAALGEALHGLFAPVVARRVVLIADGKRHDLGALRAGEELVWEGLGRSGRLSLGRGASRPSQELAAGLGERLAAALATDAPHRTLVAVDSRDIDVAERGWPARRKGGRCDPRGPAKRHSGVSSDASPLALVEARSCEKPNKPAQRGAKLGVGMPKSPLLGMLRQRIVPAARGCFRRDRAGRPDYSVRAVFEFRLAEREVVSADVKGKIGEELRRCLLESIDRLEVPPFSGVVSVRYPLVTERAPKPEQIELSAGTEAELDRMFRP